MKKKTEERARMAELEAQGLTRKTISERMGVTPSRVTQMLGLKRKYNRKPKKEEHAGTNPQIPQQ